MSSSLRRIVVVFVSLCAVAIAVAACGGGGHGHGSAPGPVLGSVTPARAVVDASVMLAGSNFGATQGTSTVDFGGAVASIVSWSDHQIVAKVPAASYPGPAAVTVTVKTKSATQPFEVVLPDAVYVQDSEINPATEAVEGFAIASDGTLSALPGSPYLVHVAGSSYGGDSQSIRVDAGRRRLYATEGNYLVAYDIDPRTGVLSSAGGPILTGGARGFGVGLIPGREVFTANCISSDISAFLLGSSGSITAAPGSPYAVNDAGACAQIVLVVRDGKFVWVTDGANGLSGYSVSSDGALSPFAPGTFSPGASNAFGGVTDPAGTRILFPDEGSDQLYVLNVNAGTGALTVAPGSPLAVPIGPNGAAFSPDGSRAYAADYDGQLVYEYDVAPNGALGMVGSSLAASFAGISSIAVDRFGRWMAAADESGKGVGTFVFGSAGLPVPVGTPVVLGDSAADPSGIVLTP